MSIAQPYRPRQFLFYGVWNIDGLDFKVYLITIDEKHQISDAMLTSAKDYVKLCLPSIRKQEGKDHDLGYIILHAGEMSNWLIIHWWAHEDIALRMLASADSDNVRFKSEDHRRFHACVWEHVVIDHERKAWITNIMNETSSPEAYLRDVLDDGAH